MSFFALTRGCELNPNEKSQLIALACDELGLGLRTQSTDDSVLGLHSCRALSPEPRQQTKK